MKRHSDKDLWSAWRELRADQNRCSHEIMVRNGDIAQGMEHPDKSRYSNIIPFDQFRVRISSKRYINASWVTFRELGERCRFIISQAPMHPKYYGTDTRGDFWHAVHEHNVTTICNLAKVEPGFSGCALYWPQHNGECATYGDYTVNVIAVEELALGLTRRQLSVHDINGTVRSVDHLHLETWPNYGVADSHECLTQLARCCVKSQSPVLIHCSGGVGRSGTFLAIAATLRAIERECSRKTSHVHHMISFISQMRIQRHPWCVESFEQFSFAARVLDGLFLPQ